jgi:hypothetical protein
MRSQRALASAFSPDGSLGECIDSISTSKSRSEWAIFTALRVIKVARDVFETSNRLHKKYPLVFCETQRPD